MRMTQEADYAVRLIYLLAQNHSAVQGASELSTRAAVPERYTLKILSKLRSKGLVESVKGAKGGYRLARDPAAITLLDIIETIDGEVAMTKCLSGADCTRMGDNKAACTFRRIYAQIGQEVARRLADVSMQDMLDDGAD